MVGGGPAGATLATLLARGGVRVAVFDRPRPPGLVVGESLVPAVVPILWELGIEDEVRGFGLRKPGARFDVGPELRIDIPFEGACRRVPPYAYNVPRDRFDATLRAACVRAGARLVEAAARLAPPEGDRVRLAPETQALAERALGGPPDLVVDASGRARLLARHLALPERGQERRDAALFAHWAGVPAGPEGTVHSDRLAHGWSWRIPLPGRVSLGVVVDPERLRGRGTTAEVQYESVLREEPHLARLVADGKRLTPVVRYGNYQLTATRGVGENWVLAGDAFGFIDPVFSSGLFLAMDGAQELARALLRGTPAALARYEREQLRHIEAWRSAIDTFYDGRFFALFQSRDEARRRPLLRLLDPHLSRHIGGIFTGEATRGRYSRWLLGFLLARAVRPEDLPALRIA